MADITCIAGGATPQSRATAAATLTEIAEAVREGRCDDYVVIYSREGQFKYERWTTYMHAISMSAMALDEALKEMRR